MHRTFQTAIGIFNPEVVFFLGDLFDEGEWVKGPDFDKYVSRFESLFSVPEHIDIYVVPGNWQFMLLNIKMWCHFVGFFLCEQQDQLFIRRNAYFARWQ